MVHSYLGIHKESWFNEELHHLYSWWGSLTDQERVSGYITCSPSTLNLSILCLIRRVCSCLMPDLPEKGLLGIEGQLTKLTWETFRIYGQLRSEKSRHSLVSYGGCRVEAARKGCHPTKAGLIPCQCLCRNGEITYAGSDTIVLVLGQFAPKQHNSYISVFLYSSSSPLIYCPNNYVPAFLKMFRWFGQGGFFPKVPGTCYKASPLSGMT